MDSLPGMEFFKRFFRGRPRSENAIPKDIRLLQGGPPPSGVPPAKGASGKVREVASVFMSASLLLVGSGRELNRSEQIRAAAYLWGVVDALSQRANLFDIDTVSIHMVLCHKYLASTPEEAGEIAALAMRSDPPQPELVSVAQQGGQAVIRFLSSSDVNAPLTLLELLRTTKS